MNPNEQVGDVLRSGTLGIGFIGGHNAMVALYGKGHGHSRKAWDTLYEAVMEMIVRTNRKIFRSEDDDMCEALDH